MLKLLDECFIEWVPEFKRKDAHVHWRHRCDSFLLVRETLKQICGGTLHPVAHSGVKINFTKST